MNDRSVAISVQAFWSAVVIGLAGSYPAAPRPIKSKENRHIARSCVSGVLAGIIALASVTQAAAGPVCKPALAIKDIQFSEMQPPTLERRWTAVVSVDASRCAMNTAGYFDVGFSRLKENGIEVEFREQFIWLAPAVKVSVDFWADEAVEAYWLENVTPCPCRG